MATDYIEILVFASLDANELAGLLHQPGCLGTWEDQDRIHVYWDSDDWNAEARLTILQALIHLGVSNPGEFIRINTVPWQNWNAQWAEQVRPVQIGQRIAIRPSWQAPSPTQSRIELIIDPMQAFGTGHHTTTQLVIEMMEGIVIGKERVLDIGTGSGILGMVALRLGAQVAVGIDTDHQAIQCAREYARVNHFGDELQFQTGTLDGLPVKPYDILFANIDRRTLGILAKNLYRYANPGSHLLVSGILLEDVPGILTALTRYGWSLVESRDREEWAGLHLRHLPRHEQAGITTPANSQGTE